MLITPKLIGAFFHALCLLLLLTASMTTMGQNKPADLNRPISISMSNQSLLSVLNSICAKADFNAVVPQNKIPYNKLCSVEAHNEPFITVLDKFLEGKSIGWERKGNNIVFSVDTSVKKITIEGVITDNSGQPLIGATIKVKGSHTGSTADEKGHFTITADKKAPSLIITYTGYDSKEVAVPTTNYVDVVLKRSDNLLDEVVAIAYGSTSRKLNTGSVIKITDKDIGPVAGTNPLAALQGRVAGLAVTASSGVPGTSYSMQIQGRNSIDNGSEPLFIVDGIPIITPGKKINILSSIASQNIDNGGISFFNNLNGADIESMEVLKGADATAIYGSRGANGVILISTKQGKSGKTVYNLDVATGIKQVGHMPQLLSTPQYLSMRKEAFLNDGLTPAATPGDVNYAPDLTLWDQHRDVNWQKYLIGNTAHTMDANASVSGGTKTTRFYFSTGYHHESSVFPSDIGYDKGTFNLNVNHKSANARFTVDFNTKYSTDDNDLYNAELTSMLTPPNAPALYDKTGKLNWSENGGVFDNPAADLLKTYQIKTHNWLMSIKPGYEITKNLIFRTNFGYNGLKTNEYSKIPISSQNPLTNSVITGLANFGDSKYNNYIIEPQLDYSALLFDGKISALVGGSWQYNATSRVSSTGGGYTNDTQLNSLAAATDTVYPSNEHPYYKYAAVFGRFIYNYKDRYIVNVSARRDGSSRFGPQKPYANFGSVGAAWLFTNEAFAKDMLPFLGFGKLRSSYGVTGNDQVGDYRYLDLWSSSGIQPYQGIPTVQPQALLNPTFSWERNKKLEVAVELSSLNDRIFLSTSYYRNRSDNQLLEFKLPSQSGFMMITRNLPAVIRNTGWEFTTTLHLVESNFFKWTVNANLTIPSNKLVRYPGIENSSYNTDYAVGQSVNVIKGYRSTGINKNTGVYTFKDVDMDTKLTTADYQILGKTDPDFYGGINNSIKFHQFQLDFLLEFKNQTVISYYYSAYIGSSRMPGFASNQPIDVLNRWQHAGDNTGVQKFTTVTSSDAYAIKEAVPFSDIAYTSGNYLKIRNASLSYALTEKNAKSLKLKSLHIYIQGQNLFTFTGYKGFDPETPYYFSLPPLRTVRVGLQIGL